MAGSAHGRGKGCLTPVQCIHEWKSAETGTVHSRGRELSSQGAGGAGLDKGGEGCNGLLQAMLQMVGLRA